MKRTRSCSDTRMSSEGETPWARILHSSLISPSNESHQITHSHPVFVHAWSNSHPLNLSDWDQESLLHRQHPVKHPHLPDSCNHIQMYSSVQREHYCWTWWRRPTAALTAPYWLQDISITLSIHNSHPLKLSVYTITNTSITSKPINYTKIFLYSCIYRENKAQICT